MKTLKKIEPYALVAFWIIILIEIYYVATVVPWWAILLGIVFCLLASAYLLWIRETWDNVKFTKKELLNRGFKLESWTSCGKDYEEYVLIRETSIRIINLIAVDLIIDDKYIPIPNCRTLKQLDALIDLLKE